MAKVVAKQRHFHEVMGRFVMGCSSQMVSKCNRGLKLCAIIGGAMSITYLVYKAKTDQVAYHCKLLSNSNSYGEWLGMLDMQFEQRGDKELFDEDLVQDKLKELHLQKLDGAAEEILFNLCLDLERTLGNMCNSELHKGRFEVPLLIQDYVKEVRYTLAKVCELESNEFSIDKRIALINTTRHAFGRTALLLSGGAALGAFHVGVVKTLIEHRLLPRVLGGASVGSIICAIIATKTWSQLQSFFFHDPMPPMDFFGSIQSIFEGAHRLLTKGALHDIRSFQQKMRNLVGDMTFQEAYDHSGRVLSISVCSSRQHEPPRCLNYLTSPHVVIWSAAIASCAFPGLFEAQELMAKNLQGNLVPYHSPILGQVELEGLNNMNRHWRDGSLQCDLPKLQIKGLFNVNYFIVSQANLHIAPLLRMKELIRVYGGDFAAKLAHVAEMEVKHRCKQALTMGFQMGGLAELFAQEWDGDVTIVMPATIPQLARIISNPTEAQFREADMQGQRCTWEKLSAIKNNCGIELGLDESISQLNHLKKARASTSRRIPSWNCFAQESSWDSMDEDVIGEKVQMQVQEGGPWGGRSVHKLRTPHNNHDDSDNGGGEETLDYSNDSWTRVGGPLMKSASALKFVLE